MSAEQAGSRSDGARSGATLSQARPPKQYLFQPTFYGRNHEAAGIGLTKRVKCLSGFDDPVCWTTHLCAGAAWQDVSQSFGGATA